MNNDLMGKLQLILYCSWIHQSMKYMILKTCNIFKKEYKKEMEKHKRQTDNISHESLMAENFITNKPSGLQMSN